MAPTAACPAGKKQSVTDALSPVTPVVTPRIGQGDPGGGKQPEGGHDKEKTSSFKKAELIAKADTTWKEEFQDIESNVEEVKVLVEKVLLDDAEV